MNIYEQVEDSICDFYHADGNRQVSVLYVGRETRRRLLREMESCMVNPCRNAPDRMEYRGLKVYVVDAEEYLEVG